ncbi:MAG: carbamate kinase [Gemmatimonadetes bacterium]|nr:carbamate kinase [Gemmatimonadota bacterium]
MGRVCIALGGHALLRRQSEDTADEMRKSARTGAEKVADIAAAGWEVVVTHGNGPQVGRILLQNQAARRRVPPMPLDVCVAQSQGQIGYMLQTALGDVFYERGMVRPVVTLVTLTGVQTDDPAFRHPEKPVGPFYSEREARRLAKARGYTMAPDAKGGWRRLVPSPEPRSIVEGPVIRDLVAAGVIVIACGGGGVPVIEKGPRLVGVEGVVDKDLAASILARGVDATVLLILTDVKGVYRNFGTEQAELIPALSADDARTMLEAGELGAGTMEPKVRAAVEFVEAGGEGSVIAALEDALAALGGEAGTTISEPRT